MVGLGESQPQSESAVDLWGFVLPSHSEPDPLFPRGPLATAVGTGAVDPVRSGTPLAPFSIRATFQQSNSARESN